MGNIMTTDNKVGRPRLEITDEDFDKLVEMAKINCTQDEICSVFDMCADTLDARLKERGFANFSDFFKKHSGMGKQSLRRIQWQAAQDGSVPMMIWLGKNWLNQSDKQVLTSTHEITAFEVIHNET